MHPLKPNRKLDQIKNGVIIILHLLRSTEGAIPDDTICHENATMERVFSSLILSTRIQNNNCTGLGYQLRRRILSIY